MRENEHIGARIAAWRRMRGLTQRELAESVNCSVSLMGKVERGDRAATPVIIAGAARKLQVDRATLTGQPYPSRNRHEDQVHASVAAVRREVASYRLPPEEQPVPVDLTTLWTLTRRVSALRHRADLQGLGAALPEALHALRTAAYASSGTVRESVMTMLAEVYYAARQFTHKAGYTDLTSLLGDRYEWAAEQTDDPHLLALADVLRSGELDAAGDSRGSRSVLAATVARFDLRAPTPQDLSIWGWLHLMSAYMAAHAGDAAATWAHYGEAHDAAERLGADRDDYRLAFGPTNVGIWGTSLGVELMDSGEALARADQVILTGRTPPERAGHHYIDLARAQLLHGRRKDALESLQLARTITPQQVRYHPLARDVVLTLAQAERRSSSTLRGMAAWMGLEE